MLCNGYFFRGWVALVLRFFGLVNFSRVFHRVADNLNKDEPMTPLSLMPVRYCIIIKSPIHDFLLQKQEFMVS